MAKKILTVVGARPNVIKISQLEKELAKHGDFFEHYLVHTGQHYDDNMSGVFFEQFKLRLPDTHLAIEERQPARLIGHVILELEKILATYKPDIVLVVGDINSTLAAAITAKRCGILVGHIESGLRSFDSEMPEEQNRSMTDAIADIFFVTEESGRENLRYEKKEEDRIHFVGNTMIDTLVAFRSEISASTIDTTLGVTKGSFALVTMHRPSNVDSKDSLGRVVSLLSTLAKRMQVVFPIHPRTKAKLVEFGLYEKLAENRSIVLTEPLDYFAFQKLIAFAKVVVTDSGGIQEETTFGGVPCLTLRENTERPSTIEVGTNTLVSFDMDMILKHIDDIESGTYKKGEIPPLWDGKATERIVNVLKQLFSPQT